MQIDIIGWLSQNKTWLLSGIGVAIPIAVVSWLFSRRSTSRNQTQRSGAGSANLQAGRDIRISMSPPAAPPLPTTDIPKKLDSGNAPAELAQRPWVSVAKIDTKTNHYRGPQTYSVYALLTMRNGGNSPALEFICSLWFEARPQAVTQIAASSLDETSAGVVGPHEQLQLEPRLLHFTQQEWDQLREKTQFLLLYGICRYIDIFGATHHTRWCYRYIVETQQFAPWNAEVNTMD